MPEKSDVQREIEEFIVKWNLLNDYNETLSREHLFNNRMRLDPRNMVYLFSYLEQKYNIVFDQEDIVHKKIFTIEDISNTVVEKINSLLVC